MTNNRQITEPLVCDMTTIFLGTCVRMTRLLSQLERLFYFVRVGQMLSSGEVE